MLKPRAVAIASSYRDRNDHTVLVLQGGGALGAYQAGVYEALSETGFAPDWVTGVSIGAVNAALIAGNPPERRLPRLRDFWDRVSSGIPPLPPAALDPLRVAFNRFSASATAILGVPGFFQPRLPPPFFAADGTDAALSFYDTSPLRRTLNDLVDFDIINAKNLRFAVGATHVKSGNSVYFESKDYEFSRATVRTLWDAGRDAVRKTIAHPDWSTACSSKAGLHAFDLTH